MHSSATSTAPDRLPHFVVIGAMKSGTTSLHRYLSEHPQVGVSRRKETDFFIAEDNWPRGPDWYRAQFDARDAIRGEVDPNYAKFPMHRGVPARMHSLLPGARLIYIVREPVGRLVSHYLHNVDAGRERRSLDAALADLADNHYLRVSQYWYQLERFLEVYPPEQVLVISLEALRADPAATLERVAEHIGASPAHGWSRQTRRRHGTSRHKLAPNVLGRTLNRTVRPVYWALRRTAPGLVGRPLAAPAVSPELRRRLEAALAEDVARIREFAGGTLDGWPPAAAGARAEGG